MLINLLQATFEQLFEKIGATCGQPYRQGPAVDNQKHHENQSTTTRRSPGPRRLELTQQSRRLPRGPQELQRPWREDYEKQRITMITRTTRDHSDHDNHQNDDEGKTKTTKTTTAATTTKTARTTSGAPNENIVQNYLNTALLNVL